jgi:hypothetical protein
MTRRMYGSADYQGVGFHIEEQSATHKAGAVVVNFLAGLVLLTIFVGATILANILTDKIGTWSWCTAHPNSRGCSENTIDYAP